MVEDSTLRERSTSLKRSIRYGLDVKVVFHRRQTHGGRAAEIDGHDGFLVAEAGSAGGRCGRGAGTSNPSGNDPDGTESLVGCLFGQRSDRRLHDCAFDFVLG